jgi:dynein intermediate chain
VNPTVNRHDEVAVTAMGFPDGETSQFWVGTEEGYIYQAGRHRPGRCVDILAPRGSPFFSSNWHRNGRLTGPSFFFLRNSKSGITPGGVYDRHNGPVTSLQFHPQGPIDVSDLFITSSMDWTVKLWQAKVSSHDPTPLDASLSLVYLLIF